jgi:riboflavin synthase
MFTGIVQTIATIVKIEKKPGLHSFIFDMKNFDIRNLQRGASIAVNGVCLTVTAIDGHYLHFDVMAATLQDTTLGALTIHDKVNIERSARFGDEIGGHILSGHVQGVACLLAIEQPLNNYILTLTLPEHYQPYLFQKGYIALNGISLTLQAIQHQPFAFSVHIIPETLKRTTLSDYHVGDNINFEIDPQTIAIVDTINAFHNADTHRRYSANDP